jgi:imidazolonepropionase-like amidohydrolase
MVAAGLSPYEALRTGTINVATHLGAAGRRGTIAPGMDADLVLIEANPLADVAHASRIAGVMVNGRWHDRADLDARLARVREAARD